MSTVQAAEHFEQLHRAHADPWSVDDRWYEQRKRQVSLALLARPRYGRAFEPGCSVGALSEGLADRCDALVAADGSEAAVATCRARLAGRRNVVVERRVVPEDWPTGHFDLVVLSELGYYLDAAGLDALLAASFGSLAPGGHLLAVHWRHVADDFLLPGGDEVHARIAATAGLHRQASYLDADFRAELFATRG